MHETEIHHDVIVNSRSETTWDSGVEVYDACKKEMFILFAMIYCTTSDFPAYGNLSGYGTKVEKACPLCEKDTHSQWLTNCRKTVYMGHRRFLEEDHPYRKKKSLFDGTIERRVMAEPLNGHDALSQVADLNIVPSGYSANIKKLVSMKDFKLLGMKSHDCHILMRQMIPIAIRRVLPHRVLRRLGSIFTLVYAAVQKLKKDSWKELQFSLVDNSKLNVEYPMISTTLWMLAKMLKPCGAGSKGLKSKLQTKSRKKENSRLMNEFDKFVAEDGESLTYVYESQFEPHVKASKVKKDAMNHDPLALVANSHDHSLYSHASSSYSRSPQPYYVTHPSSVIDNDDDYQGEIQRDAQEDKRSTANDVITTIYHKHYQRQPKSSIYIIKHKEIKLRIQDGLSGSSKQECKICIGKELESGKTNRNQATNAVNGHYARDCPKPRVRDAKYFREKMLLATKDEAGVHLDEKENDFMLDNAYEDNALQELNATVIMMAHIGNASQIDMIIGLFSKSDHEDRHHEKLETIIHTTADDQIDSDIIFNDPYVDNNSGQAEHDANSHYQPFPDFESLINNVQVETENQRKLNIELQKQKALLQRELKTLASFISVRRPESKESNSKKRVLLNTKFKSTSKDVKKSQSSFSLVSNKRDTLNLNVSESNANVLKAKTVNAVNDGSNLVCVSCGKDVFMISHDQCVARYALSPNSRVKRALFTSHVAAKSSQVGATLVVAKSRFSVATPPKAMNKVSRASSLTPESRQNRTLRTYMNNKIKTSRKWQKLFENQSNFNWSPNNPNAQTPPSVTKSSTSARTHSRTVVTKQQWVAKLSTHSSVFVACDAGDSARPLDWPQTQSFLGRNLEGEDLLTGSHDSNLYTISISKMAASSPVCLKFKATSTKSWLWHRRLSHLNFGTINHLTKQDLVDGLSKFKYDKDQLCSAREQEKSKKAILTPKLVLSTHSKLELIHMDLCEPMRVESINGKIYILVIVDDYFRYTGLYFLRTKDEALEMIIKFITQI
ncbi:retrovirus-related pol polyprotein from transposon TNT 1-94 [Tanacetum coccineum]